MNRLPQAFQILDEPHRPRSEWTIVLAGGEGQRLRDYTETRYGAARPKQYCRFWGERTMLEWTLERAAAVVENGRVKIVIADGHEQWFEEAVTSPHPSEVVVQPKNKGTLPGILLPLSHVLAEDPDATVLILPSDHFILPDRKFAATAKQALRLAAQDPNRVVLLGAVPDSPTADYGWIQRGESAAGPLRSGASPVEAFVEKPGSEKANQLYKEGWLWNTMIFAAKARLIWELSTRFDRELTARFEIYRRTLAAVNEQRVPPSHERLALRHLYSDMAAADFSRDLAQRFPRRCTVLPMDGVYWTDCGHPLRLAKLIEHHGETSEAGVATRKYVEV